MEYNLSNIIDLLKEENFYDLLNSDDFFEENPDFILNLNYFNTESSEFIDYLQDNSQFIDVIYNNLLKLYPFTQNLIKNILNFKLVKYPDMAFVDIFKATNGLYNFLNEYKKDLSFNTTKSFNDLNFKVEKLKDEIESKSVFEKQWYFIESIKNLLNDLQNETLINKKIMVQLHQDVSEKNLKLAYIENKEKQTDESKKIIESLKLTNEHLYIEINDLNENLKQLNKEKEQIINNHKNELILKNAEFDKLLKEKNDNEKTINVLKSEIENYKKEVSKMAEIQRINQGLKNNSNHLNAKNEELTNLLKSKDETIHKFTEELKTTKSDLQNLEKEKTKKDGELTLLNDKLERIKSEKESNEQKIEELEKTIKEKDNEIEKAIEKANENETLLSQYKEISTGNIEKIESEKSQLKNEIKEKNTEIEKYQDEISEKYQETKELKLLLKQQSDSIIDLEKIKKDNENDIKKLKEELKENENEKKKLTNTIKLKNSEVEDIIKKNNETENLLVEYKSKSDKYINEIVTVNSYLEEEIVKLNKQLKEKK